MKEKRCFQDKKVKLEGILSPSSTSKILIKNLEQACKRKGITHFSSTQTKEIIEGIKQAYTWVKKEKDRVNYINPWVRYKI